MGPKGPQRQGAGPRPDLARAIEQLGALARCSAGFPEFRRGLEQAIEDAVGALESDDSPWRALTAYGGSAAFLLPPDYDWREDWRAISLSGEQGEWIEHRSAWLPAKPLRLDQIDVSGALRAIAKLTASIDQRCVQSKAASLAGKSRREIVALAASWQVFLRVIDRFPQVSATAEAYRQRGAVMRLVPCLLEVLHVKAREIESGYEWRLRMHGVRCVAPRLKRRRPT